MPELKDRIDRGRHRSLRRRLDRRYVVEPHEAVDTDAYLRYRLARAGCDRSLFPSDAVAVLHERTGGLIRDIDRLADFALDLAPRRRAKLVHKDVVLDAIQIDLNGGLA